MKLPNIYIYYVKPLSETTATIYVFRNKENIPLEVGKDLINLKNFDGYYAAACTLINKIEQEPMAIGRLRLLDSKIQVIEL